MSSVRRSPLLFLLLAASLLTLDATAQPATKRILILTGTDPNHPGFSILTQRFRSIVRDGLSERVEFSYELQEGLIQSPKSPNDDAEMIDYFKRKYGGGGIDLILAAAAPRLRILLKEDPELFAGVPKVFYEFDEEREAIYRDLGPNITGVWAKIEYSRTLDIARALQPDARRVVVVAGSSPEAQVLSERARTEFSKYEGRIEFTYLTDLTLAELKSQLAALPRDSIVFYLLFYTDKTGNRYPGSEALSLVAPTSGAPLYGNSDTYLGAGIVGGSLLDFEEIGKRLGEVCLRVLRGERPGDIPPQTAPNMTVFDWRELRRWGISEDALPPGSVVKFKQFSFWELYKWYIVGLVAAVIIEALLIAGLLLARVRRRQAEAGRQQSEERNRSILQAIPDLMFIQGRDGVYLDYHAKDVKDHYLPPEEFIGKSVRDVMPPELAEKFLQSFKLVNGSGDPQVIEYVLDMGGQENWYEARLVRTGDNIMSVVRDITKRKRAEEALRQTQADLARMSRVTALGELAASIAHEVNQPLASVIGNAEICLAWLSGEAPDLVEVREAISDIHSDGHRAGEILKRIRNLARKGDTQKAEVDINEVVGEVMSLVASAAGARRVRGQSRLCPDLPQVHGDRVQLQQVLLNLLVNAMDAMGAVEEERRELVVETRPDGEGGGVLVAVSDTGPGLRPEDAEKVFGAFYTTKAEGMGMGLSISRSIIRAHGGRLWVEPNDGGGACFRFTLPPGEVTP